MKQLLALALLAVSLPASADDAPRWEYAELSSRSVSTRPPRAADENQPLTATLTLRWTTASEEVTAASWAELADKVKAKVTKDGSASLQRIQLMNAIGAEGWDVVERVGGTAAAGFGTGTTTILFKRRAH